ARVFSLGTDADGHDSWRLHATARLRPRPADGEASDGRDSGVGIERLKAGFVDEQAGASFYQAIWHPQFELGTSFRLVETVLRREGEALARVRFPSDDAPAVRAGVRPELLAIDACVQVVAAALPTTSRWRAEGAPVLLGTGHERFTAHRPTPSSGVWCRATIRPVGDSDVVGDLQLFDDAGLPVAAIEGIRLKAAWPETLQRLAGAGRPRSRPRRSSALSRQKLLAEPREDRVAMVTQYVHGELAAVLGVPPSELADDQPISSLVDSLMVVELKTRIENDLETEIPVGLLLEEPSIAVLADSLLTGLAVPAQPSGRSTVVASTMTVEQMLKEAVLDPSVTPRSASGPVAEPVGVLLTGATGFVGAFLLAELVRQTDATVYCLVRASDTPGAMRRIRANMESYGLAFDESRVFPVLGDLARPGLGLDPDLFDALAASVDGVYHCGATVKWTYPYTALKPANVLGTQETLRLASRWSPVPLHFVSTVGVFAGPGPAPRPVGEDEPLEHSGALSVGYAQSKWVAEKLVTIARSRGLPASIYRPSIGAESGTGVFNRHDHVCLVLKGCIELGAAPELDVPVQIAPIDYVAKAVVHLSLRPDQLGSTFHLVNPEVRRWSELFDHVRALGYHLARLTYSEWVAALADAAQTRPEGALYGLLPFFTESTPEGLRLPIFDSSRAQAALAGTGIACPPLEGPLLGTFIAHLRDTGFLPPPPTAAHDAVAHGIASTA
ncbi:MAG: thioester reductase domain-containing protein, partial [Acidimicrobiales bacterium]